MSSFWFNKSIVFLILLFILGIISIWIGLDYNYFEKISISITLLMVLATALSTLYSNYKNDLRIQEQNEFHMKQLEKQLEANEKNIKEQLLFNKKQEVHLQLYNELSEFWEFFDNEKCDTLLNLHNLEFMQDLDAFTFVQILETITKFKLSPEFNYLSPEIKERIVEFLDYCKNNCDMNYLHAGKFNETFCLPALEILSKIFPLLRKEFGENL